MRIYASHVSPHWCTADRVYGGPQAPHTSSGTQSTTTAAVREADTPPPLQPHFSCTDTAPPQTATVTGAKRRPPQQLHSAQRLIRLKRKHRLPQRGARRCMRRSQGRTSRGDLDGGRPTNGTLANPGRVLWHVAWGVVGTRSARSGAVVRRGHAGVSAGAAHQRHEAAGGGGAGRRSEPAVRGAAHPAGPLSVRRLLLQPHLPRCAAA